MVSLIILVKTGNYWYENISLLFSFLNLPPTLISFSSVRGLDLPFFLLINNCIFTSRTHWQTMPEGGRGRKGPGWFSPRATQFNLPAFPLRLQVPGWCIASFFVIPFLISYFAVTVKWFNFADFFGRVAIFACRACIYVSFLYPFRLRAVINHKRNANCAQICCIRKNICYIAWQSKRRMIDTPNGIFSSDISQL